MKYRNEIRQLNLSMIIHKCILKVLDKIKKKLQRKSLFTDAKEYRRLGGTI